MQSEEEIKVFLCPFNPYHKSIDNRKNQYHIARCKDRRGKSLYHCRHFQQHCFTDLQQLTDHEATCDRQLPKQEESPFAPPQTREPTATYCKYNHEHTYRTLADREAHEQVCPNKTAFELNMNKSQQIYQKHKLEFKKAQGQRRSQMEELFGSTNVPQSAQLPHLTYKYKMNEPFVQGEAATVQDSHQQARYKIEAVYGLVKERAADADKQEWQDALVSKFEHEQPDVKTLLVKQDTYVRFGLQVAERRDCALFELDIEHFICFAQFAKEAALPEDCALTFARAEWAQFVETHWLLKLDILQQENDQSWQYLARQQVDAFSAAMLSQDPSQRRTICFQATPSMLLFLVTRSTELIGEFLESDFVLLGIVPQKIEPIV
jgi:hypothetical protein